jgi:thiol-disulfide isomerase/thioredoxin
LPYATGNAGLALTVRGSSRRIMIMRFRPANIRLINRRSILPGLLLALCSKPGNNKNNPTDRAQLTGALHIKGKALIVNFWATWCGNCKVEMPWLAELREKYASQGLEVLGIVTDDAPTEKIESLAQKYGVKYPILGCNHAAAQAYGGLPYLPESFFIDRHGRIVAEMDGADSKEEIERDIRKTLGLGVK